MSEDYIYTLRNSYRDKQFRDFDLYWTFFREMDPSREQAA